jgi:hypothetical protein
MRASGAGPSRGAATAWLWHLLAAAWVVATAILLLTPPLAGGGWGWAWKRIAPVGLPPGSDWVGHLLLFGLGALLLHGSFRAAGMPRALTWALGVTIAYSLALEGAQGLVPGRLTQLADGIANAAGACCYAGLHLRRGAKPA